MPCQPQNGMVLYTSREAVIGLCHSTLREPKRQCRIPQSVRKIDGEAAWLCTTNRICRIGGVNTADRATAFFPVLRIPISSRLLIPKPIDV